MINMLMAFAAVAAIWLAVTAHGVAAAASSAITVAVGGWVTLPASGIVRADINPAESAVAWIGTDAVTIYGIRPGTATLVLTAPDGIEARPVQIVAAAGWDMSLVPRPSRCSALGYTSATESSHIALDASDLALDWTPASWRVDWTPPEGRFSATSALVTPLQSLGVPVAPGVQAEWHDGWELMASNALALVGYRAHGVGTVAVGNSTLGPAGLMEATLGGVSLSAAALTSRTGQLLSTAQAGVNIGSVYVGYATGPAGGSPTVHVQSEPVSASATASPTQGVQLGLGVSLAPGLTFGGTWMSVGGWQAQAQFVLSIGARDVAQASGDERGLCGRT